MRSLALTLLLAFSVLTPDAAQGQVVVRTLPDPRAYVSDVSGSMARTGIEPLRQAYASLFATGEVPQEIESALGVYDQIVGTKPAVLHRVVEDIVLGDALRSIYTYHYFGDNAWLFVRYDFARVSDREWAIAAIAFSSEWGHIARVTTPSFRPAR